MHAILHPRAYMVCTVSTTSIHSNAVNPRQPLVMASSINKDAQLPSCHGYGVYSPVLKSTKQPTTDSDIKSPIFHLFPSLPVELRVKIWTVALLNETTFYETRDPYNEHWERYADIDIHIECDDILVMTRRHYPTLFFVNCESRAEAAKIDGGKWYPLGMKNTNVYANVEKDVI